MRTKICTKLHTVTNHVQWLIGHTFGCWETEVSIFKYKE